MARSEARPRVPLIAPRALFFKSQSSRVGRGGGVDIKTAVATRRRWRFSSLSVACPSRSVYCVVSRKSQFSNSALLPARSTEASSIMMEVAATHRGANRGGVALAQDDSGDARAGNVDLFQSESSTFHPADCVLRGAGKAALAHSSLALSPETRRGAKQGRLVAAPIRCGQNGILVISTLPPSTAATPCRLDSTRRS